MINIIIHLYGKYIRLIEWVCPNTCSNTQQFETDMLRRGTISISMFSNSALLVGWCRGTRRRTRRRRGGTIRLGNKRRGFCLGSRPVLQWGVMVGPFRMLKKIIIEITPNGRLIDACYWSLPYFFRPQIFPLCWPLEASIFFLLAVFSFVELCDRGNINTSQFDGKLLLCKMFKVVSHVI